MEALIQDFRYALRQLRRTPAFAAIAIITLAIGIGANTAIFSVVSAVLLRPLPYLRSEALVSVRSTGLGGRARFALSYPDYLDIAQLGGAVGGAAVFRTDQYNLSGAGDAREIRAGLVSPNLFEVLGVKPVMGRAFAPAEEQEPVAVLSHRFWQAAYGGDSAVIGRVVLLDGRGFQVIGVMPPTMRFPDNDVELWIPVGWTFAADPQLRVSRIYHAYQGLVRLAPGTTLERLRADLAVLSSRINAGQAGSGGGQQRVQITVRGDGPRTGGGGAAPFGPGGPPGGSADQGGRPQARMLDNGFMATSLRDDVVGDTGRAIAILAGAVALVLLIACANVANLLVARASGRQREIAVRRAIGAGRARLIRQLLTESVVLALLAALLGLGLSQVGMDAVLALWPAVLPRVDEIGINAGVLGFTLVLSVLTGVAFGLVPAFRASSSGLEQSLRDESGLGGSRRRRRTQAVLVVSEIALALVLLVGAGLLVRSFIALNNVDPGFEPRNVMAARVRLTPSRYPSPQAGQVFFDRLADDLRRRPGIEGVTVARTLPLSGARQMLTIDPRDVRPDDPEGFVSLGLTVVGADFFSTMKIPILSGRPLTPDDRAGQPPVAVVNTRLAERFWPGENPLGKTLPIGMPDVRGNGVTVVGVVGPIRGASLADAEMPELFLPLAQSGLPSPQLWVAVRSPRTLEAGPMMRQAVRSIDEQQPIAEVLSVEQMVARDQSARRLNTALLTFFALVAVALAIIGIYGVTAYAVTQRTREFGVRVALGARPADVLRLVVRENVWLVVGGVVAGIVISVVASRALAALLFGIGRLDVVTFAGTALMLSAVALAATLVPARRAVAVDPVVALRSE